MCMICEAFGEGTRWYYNPKNYARQMYKRRKPGQGAKDFGTDPEAESGRLQEEMLNTRFTDRDKFEELVREANERMLDPRFQIGQVIPLREALEVCDLAYPIAALGCICRRMARACEETSFAEYSCTGLGVGMFKWERWPERYKGGVYFMSPDEAKEWLTKWDKRGMMHMIMTFGGSYVGGLCNCDYPDCGPIRNRVDYGLIPALFKGHHVAKVNYDQCNGCGVCVQRCQFGAIKFEVSIDRPNIDHLRCFGCGLCETGCPRKAIELLERESMPALREVW